MGPISSGLRAPGHQTLTHESICLTPDRRFVLHIISAVINGDTSTELSSEREDIKCVCAAVYSQ